MNFKILKEILNYIEEFSNTVTPNDKDIHSFSYWLSDKLATNPRGQENDVLESSENVKKQNIDIQISILIGRMSRYAQNYSKKVFSNTKISSLEEFTFLTSLTFQSSLSKAELTRQNLVEPTSGADIIKRMVNKGLIEEFEDKEDKRSKQVRITEAGKQTMFVVFNEMELVSEIITGNLKEWEKNLPVKALNKLDQLHKDIYLDHKKADLGFIKQRYLD